MPTLRIVPRQILSRRELQILAFVARGKSNKEIGENLFIAEHTVRAHLRAAVQKLGARNRASAVHLAVQQGLLSADKKHEHREEGIEDAFVWYPSLSPRELEVLSFMLFDRKEIAKQLSIAKTTAEVYVRNIMRKLGAHNRADAVQIAVQRGYIPISEVHWQDDVEANKLSSRQTEILALLAQEKSTRQIAEMLSLSGVTVRTHLSSAMAKLGVKNREDAVAEAMRRGDISLLEQQAGQGESQLSVESGFPSEPEPSSTVSPQECTAHRWAIESPNGPTSMGICRYCGAVKEFKNSVRVSPWDEAEARRFRNKKKQNIEDEPGEKELKEADELLKKEAL